MRRHDHHYTERCDNCSADWPDWAVQLATQQEEFIMSVLSDAVAAVEKAADDAAGRVTAQDGDKAALQAEVDASAAALKTVEDKLAAIAPAPAAPAEPAPVDPNAPAPQVDPTTGLPVA